MGLSAPAPAEGEREREGPRGCSASEGAHHCPPLEGLPTLPMTRMGMIHRAGRASDEAEALAQAVRETIGDGERKAA